MNMQESLKKATESVKATVGFRNGMGKVAIKIDEMLRQHGANFGSDLEK